MNKWHLFYIIEALNGMRYSECLIFQLSTLSQSESGEDHSLGVGGVNSSQSLICEAEEDGDHSLGVGGVNGPH